MLFNLRGDFLPTDQLTIQINAIGNQIVNVDGFGYQMVSFLPIETSMEKAKLSLGYREVQLDSKIIKGHEFHYCTAVETKSYLTGYTNKN